MREENSQTMPLQSGATGVLAGSDMSPEPLGDLADEDSNHRTSETEVPPQKTMADKFRQFQVFGSFIKHFFNNQTQFG